MLSKRLLTVVCMMLIIGLGLVYVTDSIAIQLGVLIIWAVVNLMFLRLQERWKTEVKTRKHLPIIFAIFGFLLICVGVVYKDSFLMWIGVWVVIVSLGVDFYSWRKEMKKEGKEIIL